MKLKITKPFGINFSIDFSCRGVLWILSDKDDQRFWGGLKFLIPGFLGGYENLASIFFGGLI